MDADCLAGNHVSGIDAASGKLKCSGDGGGSWETLAGKPSVFPPDTASSAWTDLLAALALKAPLADSALTGTTTAEDVVASGSVQVGTGTAAVNFSYLGASDSDPAGSCAAGSEILKATSDGSTKRFYCNAGEWAEDVPATSALGDPGANGVLKRTGANTTGVAAYGDIVAMWTSCTAGYLKYDGTCSTISGPSSKAGVATQFLNAYDSATGLFTSARPTWADVDRTGSSLADLTTRGFAQLTGSAASSQLPAASTTLGAVKMAAACASGYHIASIGAGGELACTVDTGAGGSESTPALSEDSTSVTSSKTLKAPEMQSTASTDQSVDLPTASSPAASAAGHGKFSFQSNKMKVSENGGSYYDVLNANSGYAAIVAMWTTCSAGYLKYDGSCSTVPGGLADPGSNGVVKRTALNTTAAAAYGDVVALWTTCTSGYLKYDGSCSTVSGSESTPSMDETTVSGSVYSSKPIVVAGTQAKIEGAEGTPVVAASGKGAISFGSSDHRPYYSYNGGPAAKLPLAYADVVGMWTACTAGYLKYDGSCSTPSGGGDVSGQASSVDSEIALFSGTGGKTIKRATGTGYVKVTSGVMQTPAAIPAADLPVASTTVGGVKMAAGCSSGYHVSSIGAGGELTCSQDATTGGGGANTIISGACAGTATTSVFGIFPFGGAALSCSSLAYSGNYGYLMTGARTVKNLTVNASAAPHETVTFTAYKNNSVQTLACSMTTAQTTCSDGSNSFTVVQGDLIQLKVTGTASGETLANISVAMELQ